MTPDAQCTPLRYKQDAPFDRNYLMTIISVTKTSTSGKIKKQETNNEEQAYET